MTCHNLQLPNGTRAIICTGRARGCVQCGKPATRECDWRLKTRRSGTCDAPICVSCTHQPAADKDLCPTHTAEWRDRQSQGTRA